MTQLQISNMMNAFITHLSVQLPQQFDAKDEQIDIIKRVQMEFKQVPDLGDYVNHRTWRNLFNTVFVV